MRTKKQYLNILIVDRNSRVREFLKREMDADGHVVFTAVNGRQMLNHVYASLPVDLVILDPDLTDVNVSETLHCLQDRVPRVKVVLHTYFSEFEEYGCIIDDAVFVEKQGNSIEALKQVISNQLSPHLPMTGD